MVDDTVYTNLPDLIAAVNAHEGSWIASQGLGWEVNRFIWETYDPELTFKYSGISNWVDLLKNAIAEDEYARLTKEQVLSILFGIHHKSRIIDGLWVSMLEDGVTQNLLERLLALDPDKYG